MALLNLSLRFLGRQARWFARGIGFIVAGIVFEFLRRHDVIHMPGMAEPYDVGVTDPYWMSAIAYLTVTWVIRRILGIVLREANTHIQRISKGNWFKS